MLLLSHISKFVVSSFTLFSPCRVAHGLMALRNLIASKFKPILLICLCILTVHLVIFEVPSLYENFSIVPSSFLGDVDVLEEVLSNTASEVPLFNISNSQTTPPTGDLENVTNFMEDVKIFLHQSDSSPICNSTPPGLVGPIRVYLDEPDFETMSKMYSELRPGGHGMPEKCQARHRVAIIVPYRNRESHLKILLHNLHSVLKKQQLDYAIFIVEQVANQTFNRGKLMNVGFDVASHLYPWQCFIFHDVDLLPEDDRNLYTCPVTPRHMSVAVDKFNYKLPYSAIFGGISALTKEQFEQINGFSNDFWGWGGEDDDLATRTSEAGLKVSRYPSQIARYKMIKHSKESTNPINKCRYKIMSRTKQRWKTDGISSLHYKLIDLQLHKLYTHVMVDLLEVQSRQKLRQILPTCY
ncbi:unnamed protein product [Caenorhabditis angaria]|uniref:Beta-1,4-N-acetylgalactosaminyltransferase n=1 Tax=Caenorhabditis angaria TaxID=860376 RepID=A0A9P1I349_9PELO|nr:unnamed protein product [Caenorhabditis angaria]